MKTYNIIIDGIKTNTYIRGRISGMTYVLTGQPEQSFAWRTAPGDIHWMYKVLATEEQIIAITDCVKKVYPNAILAVTSKE